MNGPPCFEVTLLGSEFPLDKTDVQHGVHSPPFLPTKVFTYSRFLLFSHFFSLSTPQKKDEGIVCFRSNVISLASSGDLWWALRHIEFRRVAPIGNDHEQLVLIIRLENRRYPEFQTGPFGPCVVAPVALQRNAAQMCSRLKSRRCLTSARGPPPPPARANKQGQRRDF